MSLVSAPGFSPSIGLDVDTAASETQRSLAKSIADLQKSLAGGIEYQPDLESMSRKDGREYRSALIKCAFCAGNTRLHQSKSQDGEWTPDATKFLANVVGWQTLGDHYFCGKICLERHRKLSGHNDKTPHPVAMHGDPNSHARRAYEDRGKTISTAPSAADRARLAAEAPVAVAAPAPQRDERQHGRRP
jgi:hypothetical protein